MKARHWITAGVLLLLVAAAIVGMVRTRKSRGDGEQIATPPGTQAVAKNQQGAAQHPTVDQRPGRACTSRGDRFRQAVRRPWD